MFFYIIRFLFRWLEISHIVVCTCQTRRNKKNKSPFSEFCPQQQQHYRKYWCLLPQGDSIESTKFLQRQCFIDSPCGRGVWHLVHFFPDENNTFLFVIVLSNLYPWKVRKKFQGNLFCFVFKHVKAFNPHKICTFWIDGKSNFIWSQGFITTILFLCIVTTCQINEEDITLIVKYS